MTPYGCNTLLITTLYMMRKKDIMVLPEPTYGEKKEI